MYIKRLGDKRYFIRVSKGNGAARLQTSKTIHGTRQDAIDWANAASLTLGINTAIDKRITLGSFLESWLKTQRLSLRHATHQSYSDLIGSHVPAGLAELKLAKVEPPHVQSIYDTMQRRGLSPRTIRYTHAVLRAAFNYAIKRGYVTTNPTRFADLPKQTRSTKDVMTVSECKAFLEASDKLKNGLICILLAFTGMRPSECLALRWSDVDIENKQISVNRSVSHRRDRGGYEFTPTKTNKSSRLIPLSDDLIDRLLAHREQQTAHMAKAKQYTDLDLIFASTTGTPIEHKNFRSRIFNVARDNAWIRKTITPYSLRHTFATLLLLSGENIKIVQELLGHSSIGLTADVYSHVTQGMKKDASNLIAQLLK
jgi:integrase